MVDDLYVRRFHRDDGTPAFRRPEAGEIGRTAVANPTEPIVPATGAVPEMRRRLALAVRDEVELRKRRLAVVTYDDLLTRLDAALSGTNGEAVAARLRARFGVVLIDEFQDTDLVQWGIIRRAFGEGDTTLVLIGDPKQAIYAFRGADVYAYLKAAREAAARATLDVNWRSDQGLIDAYDAMFGGARLGHEGIVYRRVRATAANQASRLSGAPGRGPVADPRAAPRRRDRHEQGLREQRRRPGAHRPGRRRGDRRAPVLRRPRSRPAPTTARRSGASACGPATSPCSSRPTATPRSSARRSRTPASPP